MQAKTRPFRSRQFSKVFYYLIIHYLAIPGKEFSAGAMLGAWEGEQSWMRTRAPPAAETRTTGLNKSDLHVFLLIAGGHSC